MTDAYIFDHLRTPRGRGKPNGALHSITPVQLAAQALEALRDRSALDTALVDDVVLGCVAPVGEQGADIARVAALVAGYAQTVPGQQISRFCASGLEAVNTAAAQIMSDQCDLVVGGGVESMSRVPIGTDGGAWAIDPSVALQTYFTPQGIGADLIATQDGISRETLDTYALRSQQRAAHAWHEKRFARSVVPVRDHLGRVALSHDECIRQTTLEELGRLKPAFAALGEGGFDAVALQRYPEIEVVKHLHTAGNASGIVDGAAALLIGNLAAGTNLGMKPRARIVGFASLGSEPTIMLTAPAGVARRVLKRAGMNLADIDLFEVNEAFASVVLRFIHELAVDPDKVNVNGGAIAMGHPLGATGAMLVGTVLDELERRELSTALVVLCAGAGMGTATIIERV